RGGYPQFAREGFEILAAQQPQDRCRLAFGRPASPPVAPLFGSPSGRPTGSLRGPRSWFSLFAHRHLHVIPHSFSPQFGVQENPRARDALLGALAESLLRRTKRILPRLDGALPDLHRGRRVRIPRV